VVIVSICAVIIGFSPAVSLANVPEVPRIESVYAQTSTSVTIIFYGKVATVTDKPTTYTATSSPGDRSETSTSLGENGRGVITVQGLNPLSTYTFIVTAKNSVGLATSSSSASVTTLRSGVAPTFGEVTAISTGFTTQITNFDTAFSYKVTSDKGIASIAPYDGSIRVENIGYPGELATILVTASRSGYDSATTSLSARSKSSSEPSNLKIVTTPQIKITSDLIECSAGTYNFIRNGKYVEKSELSSVVYILEIANSPVSLFSADGFQIRPRFLFPEFISQVSGQGSAETVSWNIKDLVKRFPVRCIVSVSQESISLSSNSPTITDPKLVIAKPKRVTLLCKKGEVVRKVSGTNPKCPRGYALTS
jgi:hypothetical protein